MKKKEYLPTKQYADLAVGERIRIACELMSVPQNEIARRAGLHAPHLNEIIHGRRAVGLDVAQRLSKVLNIPLGRLVGQDDAGEARLKSVKSHILKIKKCVKNSKSIGEETGRIILKEIEEIEEEIADKRKCA